MVDFDKTWYEASQTQTHYFGSNDKPGLTMTYFTARSNFATYAFTWENVAMMDSLEIIASCGLDFCLFKLAN